MADIRILNVEDLLIIFNFLTLYDKLMAMRNGKYFHKVLQMKSCIEKFQQRR